jgi:hypothetical protein
MSVQGAQGFSQEQRMHANDLVWGPCFIAVMGANQCEGVPYGLLLVGCCSNIMM